MEQINERPIHAAAGNCRMVGCGEYRMAIGNFSLRFVYHPLGHLALTVRRDGIAHDDLEAIAQICDIGSGIRILLGFTIAEVLVEILKHCFRYRSRRTAFTDIMLAGDDINRDALRFDFCELTCHILVGSFAAVIGEITCDEQHIRIACFDLGDRSVKQGGALRKHEAIFICRSRLIADVRDGGDFDCAGTFCADDEGGLDTTKQHHHGEKNTQQPFAFLQIFTPPNNKFLF